MQKSKKNKMNYVRIIYLLKNKIIIYSNIKLYNLIQRIIIKQLIQNFQKVLINLINNIKNYKKKKIKLNN